MDWQLEMKTERVSKKKGVSEGTSELGESGLCRHSCDSCLSDPPTCSMLPGPPRGSCSHGLLTLANLGLAAGDPLQAGKLFSEVRFAYLALFVASPQTASVYPPIQFRN